MLLSQNMGDGVDHYYISIYFLSKRRKTLYYRALHTLLTLKNGLIISVTGVNAQTYTLLRFGKISGKTLCLFFPFWFKNPQAPSPKCKPAIVERAQP